MIKFIRYCLAYFKKASPQPVSQIDSLAPKILTKPEDLKKVQPYLDALKNAITDSEITNIALTGGYGSGKSTIIRTFQSQFPQYYYLNLSLASFKDIKDEKNGSGENSGKNLERQLEVSILQQIFYHVRPSDIPDSRFKRIVNLTTAKIWLYAASLVLWVASSLVLFQLKYVNKLDPQNWDTEKEFDFFAPIPFIIFFTGVGLFAKSIIRLFSNSKISKFTIKGELELGDKIDKSVFNEHLEEIIYFFERTTYNVVVIEDLDRFETTDIFTKLREINILLNSSISVAREINFVYAIKDEMFTDKSERVKFFEYIIPVIPFINPSNAGEQMARLIGNSSLEGVLSKEFTEDVVTFIDDIDMRLLTNIFHEYQLYRSNINDDELNQDELFAMITYKNLFPDDFGELHKRKGKLYSFIAGKDRYIEGLKSAHNKKINEIARKISNIEKEQINDLHELRKIYLLEYFNQIPDAVAFIIDGQQRKISDLIDEEIFDKLRATTNVNYQFYSSRYYSNEYYLTSTNIDLPFSKIEAAVSQYFTYDERVEFINGRVDNVQKLLKTDIQKLKAEIIEMDSWNLKKIFELVSIDPYLESFSDNYLIRNLLLNGYLNENYSDYISLFHAVNLTKEDNTFLRYLKSGISAPFEYKLTRLENLFKRISLKYFSRLAVLNFDLMDHMAENYSSCKEAYNSVIKQLCSVSDKKTSFIDTYLDKRRNHSALFINRLCKEWNAFWDEVVHKGNFTTDRKNEYLLLILEHADVPDIVELGTTIKSYIEKHERIIELLNHIDIEKAKDILTSLNVKIESLSMPSAQSHEIFDHIYINTFYKITANNIATILTFKNPDIDEQQLKKANYTTVFSSGCTTLTSYLESHLENYVKGVVLRSGNNEEAESSLIAMLNHEQITEGTKIALISSQSTILCHLSDIENQPIRAALIQGNKIKVNWENLLVYFEQLDTKELDGTLVNFLNQSEAFEPLSEQNMTVITSYDKNTVKSFFVKILYCNELSYEAYTSLIKSYPVRWIELSFEHLEKDKVKHLVENNILSFEVGNYNNLRSKFGAENYHIMFIEKNRLDFFEKVNDIEIESNELSKLLQSTSFSFEEKLKLIEYVKDTDENLIIENITIARQVCHILSKSAYIEISSSLMECLFKSSSSVEDRIRLLNMHNSKCSDTEFEELVSKLGDDYKDLFKKKHKPTFSITEYNRDLFNTLKDRRMIKSFDKDWKDEGKYRVIANYQ
ncbi:YobI family P-loop NTPase [Pararcticibacter amylolyticus]|uniref:YobI-like P-loop NTPase domain-containing protein n=1 Tax=Pararcticibacter amylolyticus TaxID=2173175 RepID=A0A2U2PGX7_9SPHI|nr:hypothetical protein [Pararcticibacter amylolyticus]PWG80661.1 hypothetical protein DDR33_11610 [Pararcticibacter amylolyticus]